MQTTCMRRATFGPLGCLLVIASAACSAAQTADPFSGGAPAGPGDERVVLTIENNDYRDATIYAWWGGARTRVGTVTGNTTQTFRVRWRSQELYLEADFLAGGTVRSRTVTMLPGEELELQILLGGGTQVRKI